MQLGEEGRKRGKAGQLCFSGENEVLRPKEKSALNIVQDASAALPQNCLERIGY
jgi:hypothetical protein